MSGSEILLLSDANASLLGYWIILRPRLLPVTAITLAMAAAVFVVDKYVRTQWYRATAIIRPASREGPISPLATMIGSMSLAQSLTALTNVGGLGDGIANDAGKYMTLLKSYDFTINLVKRHKLQPMLYRESRIGHLLHFWAKPPASVEAQRWLWYQAMKVRFSDRFDDRDGNLVLHFAAPEKNEAKRILEYYISDLRAKLSKRAVQETDAAMRSLQVALRQTPDPLVEQQLALLVAEQIRQEKTAQAEADFAFAVLEPPFVSDPVFQPKTLLESAIALSLTPLVCLAAIILYQRVYVPIRTAERALAASQEDRDSSFPVGNENAGPNHDLKMLEK